jgi:probable F420-dependent oxidoreductase
MRFGYLASGQSPGGLPTAAEYRTTAQLVDDLPYDSIWAGDHIAFRQPVLEGMVALTALAAWTSRVRVGTAVLLLPLRHPALVAKQIASVDHLSGGRVVLGVGVGGESRSDFAAVQVDPAERGRRADEAIAAMRALWSGPHASFRGDYFAFDEIEIQPRPVRGPDIPVWVGGRSAAALRRAATLGDAWLAYLVSPERFKRASRYLADVRAAHGHRRDPLGGAAMIPIYVDSDHHRARRELGAHLAERYGRAIDPPVIDRYCLAGPADHCIDQLARYAEAGVTDVVLMPVVTGPQECYRLADQVVGPYLDQAGVPR